MNDQKIEASHDPEQPGSFVTRRGDQVFRISLGPPEPGQTVDDYFAQVAFRVKQFWEERDEDVLGGRVKQMRHYGAADGTTVILTT